jgi:hypothetical protein
MAIETDRELCASFMLENFDHLWKIPDNRLESTIEIAKEITDVLNSETHLVRKKKPSSNTNKMALQKKNKLISQPANTSQRMRFNQQKIN